MLRKTPVYLLRLVPALILARSVYFDLSGHPHAKEMFSQLGMEPGGRILNGILELVCALLLLLPGMSVYGAILGLGIMLGALIAHLTVVGVGGDMLLQFALNCVTLGCCAALIYTERKQFPAIRDMFE